MLKIDFIGIGVSKAGTTTIARLLGEHPQVCLSIPKEVNFFSNEANNGFESAFDKLGLPWYRQHFVHCAAGAIKGEFSNHYFIDEKAPQRIRQTFPEARLILCLRRPVARAYSNYLFQKEHGVFSGLTFREACLQAHDVLVEKGFYCKHLKRWLRYFPKEQIFIIVLDEFKENPGRMMSDLYGFIGANPGFVPPGLHERKNEYRQSRSVWLRRLEARVVPALAGKGAALAIHWLKKAGVQRLVRKLVTKPGQYPPMNEDDQTWLHQLYADDTAQLEELLGKDLSAWKI